MSEIFRLALDEIQPSQLYLNREKLAHVNASWRPRTLEQLSPVPVKCLDGQIIYTDGHHRAFAAHRIGFYELRVVWDEDEMDWDAYRICVAWCRDVGVYTIHDLEARVVSTEEYAVCWLERCRTMQNALEAERCGPPGDLYLPSG
jgi:hypothetical protein